MYSLYCSYTVKTVEYAYDYETIGMWTTWFLYIHHARQEDVITWQLMMPFFLTVLCSNQWEWTSLRRSLCCSSGDPAAEEWSQWSVCSLTCGQGWQVRTRSCVSSPYGTLCSGALRETRMCNNTASCPGEPGITGSGMVLTLSTGCLNSVEPSGAATVSPQHQWWQSLSTCYLFDASQTSKGAQNMLWLWGIFFKICDRLATSPGCPPPHSACWDVPPAFDASSRH